MGNLICIMHIMYNFIKMYIRRVLTDIDIVIILVHFFLHEYQYNFHY